MGEGYFYNAYNLLVFREERRDGQKIRDEVNDAKLKEIVADLDGNNRHIILRSKETGNWMNIWGTTVTGTLLAAKEFGNFYAHIMMLPP